MSNAKKYSSCAVSEEKVAETAEQNNTETVHANNSANARSACTHVQVDNLRQLKIDERTERIKKYLIKMSRNNWTSTVYFGADDESLSVMDSVSDGDSSSSGNENEVLINDDDRSLAEENAYEKKKQKKTGTYRYLPPKDSPLFSYLDNKKKKI